MTMNDESRASVRDGGPAFPQSSMQGYVNGSGMTLRDYFAGQVLAGMHANDGWMSALREVEPSAPKSAVVLAHAAYAYADAMLAERGQS